MWGNPQAVQGEQPTLPAARGKARCCPLAVWYLPFPNPAVQTHPCSCHAQAADVPCWSCLCLSPALFFRPPLACSLLCAKSVQCWLCQVNYFHPCGPFAVGVAVMGLWRARDEPSPAAARLLPPWTCLEGSVGPVCKPLIIPGPFEGAGWEMEPCLFDCRAGIFRAGIVFYKKKVSKEPPARGAGDGCRGFL